MPQHQALALIAPSIPMLLAHPLRGQGCRLYTPLSAGGAARKRCIWKSARPARPLAAPCASGASGLAAKRCAPCEGDGGALQFMGLCEALGRGQAEELLQQARQGGGGRGRAGRQRWEGATSTEGTPAAPAAFAWHCVAVGCAGPQIWCSHGPAFCPAGSWTPAGAWGRMQRAACASGGSGGPRTSSGWEP